MDRKLGALLPGSKKASAVLNQYLDHVIDQAMAPAEDLDSDEAKRKAQSMLRVLVNDNVSRKV